MEEERREERRGWEKRGENRRIGSTGKKENRRRE
jgi:hypothetical protein